MGREAQAGGGGIGTSGAIRAALDHRPAADALRLVTLETHTAGEPFRIVIGGFPELRGSTVLEWRRDARERYDHLRRALMWEPRGHADMYGCLVTPAERADSAFGVLFLHNEGFSTMCGHGIIAVAKAAVETGMVEAVAPRTELAIDTPAGQVRAWVEVEEGDSPRLGPVRFQNVPSFAVALDQRIEVAELGVVDYDLAYGGAFYAYVDAASLGVRCRRNDLRALIEKAALVKRALAGSPLLDHPEGEELSFLYGVVFHEASEVAGVHSRNVCVFADGEVDRSPTGTSVSARLALLDARGELGLDHEIVIESLIGTCFGGRIVRRLDFAGRRAVVPEVSGDAFLTGRCEWWIDPTDPLAYGFLVR